MQITVFTCAWQHTNKFGVPETPLRKNEKKEEKGKVVPDHAMKAYRDNIRYDIFFNCNWFDTRWQ